MRKKIVFMMLNMNVGGTEKALLNMLSTIPKDKYELTIFMLEEYGGFLGEIPKEIKVKYFQGYNKIKAYLNDPLHILAFNLFTKGQITKSFILLFYYFLTKILKSRNVWFKYLLKEYPFLEQNYDVAVAYAGPNDFISFFVINKIRAKKKIQWIHFDVTKIGFNRHFAEKVYKKFEKIFVVSNEGKDKLVNLIPSLNSKIEVFQNIISPNLMQKQAENGQKFNDEYDGLRILTIGRLSLEKGQDLAIQVLAKLKKDGFNVRWYCLGEGNSREIYEKMIEEYNLKENFILLGADPNPYPYLQQCNLYVQSSRHEGFCLTLAEARCFRKPIVTTNFTGAKEQIINGKNGIIVNTDVEEIYKAVKLLINNPKLCEKFTTNLSNEVFNNIEQIEKIYNLVG